MSKENEAAKIILQIVKDKDGEVFTNADCSISELYNIVIMLVGILEENTKIEYNQILDDLKEI